MDRPTWTVFLLILQLLTSVPLIRGDETENEIDMVSAVIEPNQMFDHLWAMPTTNGLWIKIKACENAAIALSPRPFSTIATSTYYIHIGANENKETYLEKDEETLQRETTDNILSCDDNFQDFFVGYVASGGETHSLKIELYGSKTPNPDNLILEYEDDDPHDVNAIGFGNLNSNNGQFLVEFPKGDVSLFNLRKKDSTDFGDTWIGQRDRKSVVLGVRTMYVAKVLLCEGFNINDFRSKSYEVTLSEWGTAKIKKQNTNKAQAPVSDALSGIEVRYFWIRWENYFIQFGRGVVVGHNKILEWQDDEEESTRFDVNSLSISVSGGLGEGGSYYFELIPTDSFLVTTETGAEDGKDDWLSIADRTTFRFDLRACAPAILRLKTDVSDAAAPDVVLELDATTTVTYFNEDKSEQKEETFDTPGILDCATFQQLWFTWNGDEFVLGKGEGPGETSSTTLLTVKDEYVPSGRAFRSLHLGSESSTSETIQWRFSRDAGDITSIVTEPKVNKDIWLTVHQGDSAIFAVESCSSVNIILSNYAGVTTESSYTVTLESGRSKISRVLIDGSMEELDSASTPDILVPCGRLRSFWITWSSKYIAVGQGNSPRSDPVLTHRRVDGFDIRAISVGGPNHAVWYFGHIQADVYGFSVTSRERNMHWIAVRGQSVEFGLRACTRAHILLSKTFGVIEDGQAYEVDIGEGSGSDAYTQLSIYGTEKSERKDTPNILDCDKTNNFWLTWSEDDYLRFGQGSLETNELLALNIQDGPPVSAITFSSTDETNPAFYTFRREYGSFVQINTTTTYNLDQFWRSSSSEKFAELQVASEGPAMIYLSPMIGTQHTKAYLITFNQESVVISTGDGIERNRENQRLIDGNEMRKFRISWLYGVIQVSRWTTTGFEQVVEWHDSFAIEVHAVSVSTDGNTGKWIFSNVQDKRYFLKTSPQNNKFDVAEVTVKGQSQKKSLSFEVQSCMDARIGLFTNYSASSESDYELLLGTDDNTYIRLYNHRDEGDFGNYMFELDLLHCGEMRPFWIEIDSGVLRFGKTVHPYYELFSWEVNGIDDIHSLSFSSYSDSPAGDTVWSIPENAVEKLVGLTTGHPDFERVWMTETSDSSIQFKVKTCGWAEILLSAIGGTSSDMAYEVALGRGDDRDLVQIYYKGEKKAEERFSGVTDCESFVSFWIDWSNGLISVGRGNVMGNSKLVSWQSDDSFEVTHIAISSDNEITGEWQFTRSQGNTYQIVTTTSAEDTWVVLKNNEKHLNFQAQGCNDASIALTSSPGNPTTNASTMEIVFAHDSESDGNLQTVLREGIDGETRQRANGKTIECSKLNSFWISWTDENIKLGIEKSDDSILDYMRRNDIDFNSIALRGPSATIYEIYQNDIEMLHITTFAEDGFTRFWRGVAGETNVVFTVRLETEDSGVLVALANIPTITTLNAYVLEIMDAAGMTSLKEVGGKSVSEDLGQLLSHMQYRNFWLSWGDDKIKFGTGANINNNQKLELEPNQMHVINSAGISSRKDKAHWNIFREDGLVYKLRTKNQPGIDTKEQKIYFNEAKFLEFKLQVCFGARLIIVTSVNGAFGSNSYELVIGGENNQVTYIRRVGSSVLEVSAETPDILNCDEYTPFWMSWEDGDMQFGSDKFGHEAIFAWPTPEGAGLRSAVFDSEYGVIDVEWEIPQNEDQTLALHATNEGLATWVSVPAHGEYKFSVQACFDAHVYLSAFMEHTTSDTYLLEIGRQGNTETALKEFPSQKIIEEEKTEGVLTCGEYSAFWMRFSKTSIEFGSGEEIGSNTLLTYNSPEDNILITAMSYGAPAGREAMWLLGNLQASITDTDPADDTAIISTKGDSIYTTTVTLNSHYFVFYVMAASNARIALSKFPGKTDSDAYIIEIGTEGNTKTTIGKVGDEPKVGDTEEILSETEARPFWIIMQNNTIKIGRGLGLGDSEIIDLEATDAHLITAVSLTSTNNVEAEWSFSPALGHEVIQETSTGDTDYGYSAWHSMYNAKSVVFQVKSESDAYILISSRIQDTQSKVYEVVIGLQGNDGQLTAIRKAIYGNNEAEVPTPGIISEDEYRTFWINWQTGDKVEVGAGHIVGSNPIVALTDDVDTTQMTAIGVTSGRNKQASWRISSFGVNNFKVETPTEGTESQVWIYREAPHFEFFLRASGPAAVYITEAPLNSDNNASSGYEVFFDTTPGQPGVYLKRNPKGEVLKASEENTVTSDLIKRKFWISWYSDTLQVGRGNLFENAIVSHTLSGNPFANIRAIALSTTGSEQPGHWEFARDSGRDIVITTEEKSKNVAPQHWLELTDLSRLAFKVKSCDGISLLLADIAGAPVIEVVIGDTDDQSQPNKIINLESGEVLIHDDTTEILTCDVSSWMWLTWNDNTLSVGQDADIGGSVVMEYKDDNRNDIQSMAFRGLKNEPVFEFTSLPTRYYEIQTHASVDMQNNWLAMHESFFVFEVKAPSDAMIILKEVPGQESERAIAIVLGGEDNTKSTIYRMDTPDNKVEYQGVVLDSAQFMSFYINWETYGDKRTVVVGRRDTGIQFLIFDDSDDPIIVNEISVQSQPEEATWRFAEDAAMVKTFYTGTVYKLDEVIHRVTGTFYFVFKIMAQADCHIALFDHYHARAAYEIVVGSAGNEWVIIRDVRQGSENARAKIPGILSVNKYDEFWVSWKDGHIVVGYGRLPGFRQILEWTYPDPRSVSYLSLTTGYGSDGYYQIHTIPDGTFLYKTRSATEEDALTIRLEPSTTMYDFSIRSCGGAVIMLKTSGADSELVYKLVLGDVDNTVTTLYDPDMIAMATSSTPYILHCLERRVFHLNWARQQLRLRDINARGQVLFEYNENSRLTTKSIHGLSLSTDLPAEWAISQFEGRQLQYRTGPSLDNTNYCCMWEAVQDRTFITFSVKACSHVSVLLTVNPGQYTSDDAFEVVIGVDGQDKHEIRKGVKGEPLATGNSPDLLSCSEHRTFWISWSDSLTSGYISVGKGVTQGIQQIMVYQNDDNPTSIGAYAVSSEADDAADFRLGYAVAVNEFNVYTPDNYVYSNAVIAPRNEYFTFNVKACANAHVLLQTDPFNSESSGYEIVLGAYDNKGSDIRDGIQGPILTDNQDDGVLSCDQYASFWVSWSDNTIRVGHGIYPGDREFLTYEENGVSHTIYSVSLSTGWGSDGQWRWPVQYEDLVRLSNPKQEAEAETQFQWVSLPGFFEIMIRVRACEDVSIALADVLGNVDTQAAEVRLGANGNKESSIHQKYGAVAEIKQPSEGILSCDEFRTFWLRWSSRTVMVGQGGSFLDGRLMEYTLENGIPPVHAIGIASSQQTEIDWELVKIFGDTVSMRTPSINETEVYRHMVVTPTLQSASFRVRTCQEAGLSLRESADSDASPGYEIVIDRNDRSELIRLPEGRVAEGIFPIPSNCDLYRTYWTSWSDGTIKFGFGTIPGQLEIMSYTDPDPLPIQALSIGSLNEYPAHWEFMANSGDQYRFYTSHHQYANSPQISVLGLTSTVVSVKTCEGARLTVSTIAGITGTLTHEVILGDHDNRKVVIWDLGEQKELNSTDMNDVVSCEESRTFWLTWENGYLRVGKGSVLGLEELLSYSESLKEVTSLSLATYADIEGVWDLTFPQIRAPIGPPEDTTAVKTIGDSKYTTTVTLNARFFVFYVMAASNVRIALSTYAGQTESDTYIIELGADDNKKTTISKDGEELNSIDTEDILSETVAQPFWISAQEDKITIGRDLAVGDEEIMNIDAQDSHLITSVSLTSSNNVEAQWSFDTVQGHEVIQETATGNTEYEFTSWMTANDDKSMVFQVKAQQNAHMVLSNNLQDTSAAFEVVLGLDGGKSVMRQSVGGENEVEWTSSELDANLYKTFWISWEDSSELQLGLGHQIGQSRILRLEDVDTSQIKAVAIASGRESQASWRISSFGVNNFKIGTDIEGAESQVWIYREAHHFEFDLRAGGFATVYLAETPMNTDHNNSKGFQVTFDTSPGNAGIHIKQNPGGVTLKDYLNGEIISSSVKRKFWISWYGDSIRVGRGKLFQNEIVSHSLSSNTAFENIKAIALSTTGSSQKGFWEFSRGSGRDIVITTEEKTQNLAPVNWLEMTDLSRLAFKVKSCDGISLLLADIAGAPFAEVIIGDSESPPNKIINLMSKQTIAQDDTTGILACDIASWMWLAWDDNRVSFGRDADFGASMFLEWPDETMQQIQSMAFRGLKKQPIFEFTSIPNRYYEVKTPTVQAFQTNFLAMHGSSFTVDVRAPSGAKIILKEVPGQETSRAVIIVLGDEDNTKSVIYRVDNTTQRDEKEHIALDANEYKTFYINWQTHGTLKYVRVNSVTENTILMQLSLDDNPMEINEVSLESQPVEATWRFRDDSAMVKTFYTNTIYDLGQVVRRVAGIYSFVFKVKANADVHVVLFDHYEDRRAYEIVIGGSGNIWVLIRDTRQSTERARARIPNVLSQDSYDEFWVSWRNGHVAVGYGRFPGIQQILDFVDTDQIYVSYLALTTGYGTAGYFKINTIPDGTFLHRTEEDTNSEQLTIRLNPTRTMYDFGVKTCYEATILLKTAGAGSDEVYKLIIGDSGNRATRLYDPSGGILEEVDTPSIMRCEEMLYFHLSWTRQQIRLTEMNVGGRLVLEYAESTDALLTSDIHSLALASGSHSLSDWQFSQFEGRQLQYKTGPEWENANTKYCCMWEAVQDRTYMTFSVRSCSHVSVLLTVYPGIYTEDDAYEVVIGADGNKKNEIRKGVYGEALITDNTPDLLSCTEHRTFWISWSNSNSSRGISVGTGATANAQQIMIARIEQDLEIGAYSVSSEDQDTADFRLGSSAIVNAFNVYTPDDYVYSHAVIASLYQQFTFSVKACADAHVFLRTDPFNPTSEGFEIVIGAYDNTKSDIRNGQNGNILEEHEEDGILNCDRFENFWVSWYDGVVEVGKGIYVGEGEFLLYDGEVSHNVYSVSLSTGFGSDGKWTWPVQYEDLVRLSYPKQEPEAETQFQWVSLPGFFEIMIRIRACEDISIALVDVLGTTSTAASEVRIGDSGNSRSSIHEKYGDAAEVTQTTNDILSCDEFRTFWIKWSTRAISVGEGGSFQNGQIMEYTSDSGLPSVHALGIASSQQSAIDWELVKIIGDTVSIRTPQYDEANVYKHMIITPEDTSVSFRLRTCEEGALSLRASADSDMSPGYEIVINRNERSELIRLPDGDVVGTGPIIESDCDHYRSYWASWAGSTIRFGEGIIPGTLESLSYNDTEFHPVTAVSVASLKEHSGHWEFRANPGDKYRFYTKDHDYTYSPQISVLGLTSVIFNVRASAGARLAVSTIAGITGTLAHEVIIGDNDNKEVAIINLANKEHLAKKEEANLLSETELRPFWLIWEGGNLRVGRGSEVGVDELLRYENSLKDVTSLSLASYEEIDGIWDLTFPKSEAPPNPTTTTTTSEPTPSSTSSAPGVSPSSSTQETETQNPGAGGLTAGETTGVVFGVLIGIALIGLLIFFAERRWHKRGIENQPLVFRNSQYNDDVEMTPPGRYDGDIGEHGLSFSDPSTGPSAAAYDMPSPIMEAQMKVQSTDFSVNATDKTSSHFGTDLGDGVDDDDDDVLPDQLEQVIFDHEGEMDA